MGKKLVIVESPTKIKTLKKFLGPDYLFESSLGHIRDLPAKGFGIDVENDFEPQYAILPDKKEVIDKLIKSAKLCDTVYLSPDPDREGEAIAWHIASLLPKETNIKRASFHSITKDAVVDALNHPRAIDMALVDAQQARRLLDRIVGYKISPLLNRRVQRGKTSGTFLSAGRVQSVALKLVVDREKEIEAFKPVEYWNILAHLKPLNSDKVFEAYLYSVDGRRVEKEPQEGKDFFLIPDEKTSNDLLKKLEKATYTVNRVEKKEKKRNPVPPFITSTLQQEASRHFGFSSSKTMKVAQELYEGIDLGQEGSEGLITYMRTDSVRITKEAIDEVRKFIFTRYGKNYLTEEPRVFSTKKAAQDAHEAIRPSNLNHPPESVRKYLTKDQFNLYDLIWKRFVATQMQPAIYDTVTCDIETDKGLVFRATGSTIKFQGYLAAYQEKEDEDKKEDNEDKILPPLNEGDKLNCKEVTSDQSFTKGPARFSEASLIKELERLGIGRPSTYASIMNKIQSREYTTKEQMRLKPTELGRVIAQMLETSFQEIMNVSFTAGMEDDLERVASSEKDWKKVIKDFWNSFIPTVETAEKEAFVPKVETEIPCPKCGAHLQKIWSNSKYFYGCSKYPECDFSASQEELNFNKEEYAENFDWDQKCPNCSFGMKVRHGRFGAFLGCTKYPECKGIVNIPKKGETIAAAESMPKCPAIGCEGHMVARKSRFGKTFYSCSSFPDCDVIVNDLQQLDTKYENYERKAYVKKAKAKVKSASKKVETKTASKKTASKKSSAKKVKAEPKEKVKRVMPSLALSDELSKVVGSNQMPRAEVLKKVWDYIRENNLQDPLNKKLIKPDSTLTKLFGSSDSVDMFKLPGLLSPHMKK
jgi:DNA topoisomerase-1